MFCRNCGSSVNDGSKFCPECGYRFGDPGATAPMTVAPAAQAQPPQDADRKKDSGGFFSSPAGIALVVIIGVAVLGGLVLGGIFIFKAGANDKVDAATMEVWEDYEALLEDDSDEVARITMDTASLNQAQEDLKKSQTKLAALQEIQEEKGGTDGLRKNPDAKPANTRDIKAEQLAVALEVYKEYVKKMVEYITALNNALAGNQLINPDVVNNLNKILTELQNLAKSVEKANGEFVADNDQVEKTDEGFGVLDVGWDWTKKTEQKVNEAVAAEQARIQSETAAAQQAAAAAEQQAAAQQQQEESESGGQRIECPECGGLGYFIFPDGSTKTCPNCEGKGWYWAPY